MKTRYLLLLSICALILTNCGSEPKPNPYDEIVIFKIDNKFYNGFLVSPEILSVERDSASYNSFVVYGDSLVLPNTSSNYSRDYADFAYNTLQLLNHSPYVLLEGGYAIMHWRWRYFSPIAAPLIYANDGKSFSPNPHLYSGCVANVNESVYYISTDYHAWTDLNQKWAPTEVESVKLPEMHHVDLKKLDEYRKAEQQETSVTKKYYVSGLDLRECFKLYQKDAQQGMEYASICDSLESVYVAALNRMITNKELESWTIIRIQVF